MKKIMGNELDLRAWAEDDYWLLQRTVGDPAMTKFWGDRKVMKRCAVVMRNTWQ